MSWLALLLLAVAVGDLVRGSEGDRRPSLAAGVSLAALALGAGLAGFFHPASPVDLVVVVALAPVVLLWQRWSAEARLRNRAPARPLALLAGAAAVLVAFSGIAGPVAGPLETWLRWAQVPLVAGHQPGTVLLGGALLLANLSTGNLVVRLVLTSIGAIRPADPTDLPGPSQPSDELKGGRLLGPMERVLVLGLGLAGQVTAAGLVIAAKGLLRFPELQSKRDDTSTVTAVGIDAVTEYFLVGSFVSWLLALGSLALLR